MLVCRTTGPHARCGARLLLQGVPRTRAEKKLSSENVARQVLVLRELAQPGVDVSSIDRHRSRAALAGVKGNFLEQLFQHGVQAPGADVLGLLVHLEGDLRDAADGFRPKLHLQALGLEQRLVLLDLARVGRSEERRVGKEGRYGWAV